LLTVYSLRSSETSCAACSGPLHYVSALGDLNSDQSSRLGGYCTCQRCARVIVLNSYIKLGLPVPMI